MNCLSPWTHSLMLLFKTYTIGVVIIVALLAMAWVSTHLKPPTDQLSFWSLFRITARNILKQNITYPIIDEYISHTVYPKKYAHGFVVLCFVVVMQSFIINSHEVFIHIHQDCFAGTGAIVRLPQCQWSKPGGYGEISQCITTTKHSKAKTVCIFLGIYSRNSQSKGCSVVYHGDELRT